MDDKLFKKLRNFLTENGFIINEVNRLKVVDSDRMERFTCKWEVWHPKKKDATFCYVYEKVFEFARNADIEDPYESVISTFKWMVMFYELNEKD